MAAVNDLVKKLVEQSELLQNVFDQPLACSKSSWRYCDRFSQSDARLQPTRNVVIRVAHDLGIFQRLGDTHQNLDELADGLDADKELICEEFLT